MPIRIRSVPIPHSELLRRFSYCPETGILIRRVKVGKRYEAGQIAGFTDPKGYRRVGINKQAFGVHQVAWYYFHEVWPEMEIDHINGDRSDNRISNLRLASRAVNAGNRHGPRKDNILGVIGVQKRGYKYSARIQFGGKQRHIGLFESAEQAEQAYWKEKAKHTPGFIQRDEVSP